MNKTAVYFKPGKIGFLLGIASVITLSGCVGYVESPAPVVAVEPPVVVVQDDYVYYPNYGIYYSNSRHQYASLERGAWISEPAPRGVTVAELRASASVKMDFHDSPAKHHATVTKKYPKNWSPQRGSEPSKGHDEQDGK